MKKSPPYGARRSTAADGRDLADDRAPDEVGGRDHAPAREHADAEPPSHGAPVGRTPQQPGRDHQRKRGERPREHVQRVHDADEVAHESARTQTQHGDDTLAIEPARGLGRDLGEDPLDQDSGVGDGDQDRAASLPHEHAMSLEHAAAKQRRERTTGDHCARDRPDQGPDRIEFALSGADDRSGEMIGHVRLHGRVAQHRHRTVGERLRPEHGASRVGENDRQRQQHCGQCRRPATAPIHRRGRARALR